MWWYASLKESLANKIGVYTRFPVTNGGIVKKNLALTLSKQAGMLSQYIA